MKKVNTSLLLGHIGTNYWPSWGCLRPIHMVQFVVTTYKTYTFSDNLVSLTQLTKISAIFAFTRCDISCMLQVVSVQVPLCGLAFIDLTDGCMINSGNN